MKTIELIFALIKIYLIPIAGLLILTLAFISCNEEESPNTPPPPPSDPNIVLIQNSTFNPGSRTVTVGTTITWRNNDNIPHTVTSGTPGNPTGVFDSGSITPGKTFEFTFNTADSYDYFCSFHTGMRGKIIVNN